MQPPLTRLTGDELNSLAVITTVLGVLLRRICLQFNLGVSSVFSSPHRVAGLQRSTCRTPYNSNTFIEHLPKHNSGCVMIFVIYISTESDESQYKKLSNRLRIRYYRQTEFICH